jgi:Kef-type K+ transport system membrane component KefB
MRDVHYTNLLIVVVVAFVAPLALGFFPRLRLPAIVVEIILGIAIGPSGLDWASVDTPVSILALVGLAFLLFLAGLEIDVQRLRGRTLKLTSVGFLLSFVLGVAVGGLLSAGNFVKSPLFVAIVLVSTSLGVIVPVLKDSDNIGSDFGQLVIAAASIADFGAIILLSLFFSGKGSTDTAGKLILLGVFALVVVLIGLAIAGFERAGSLSRVLLALQDTTAQIRVRGAFVLLIGFVALADTVGLETILGAFAAGAMLSLIDRDEAMTHPQFRLKLEAAGFGIFIPVFFVTSGLRFDLNALFSSASTVARVSSVPARPACCARGPCRAVSGFPWSSEGDHRGRSSGDVAAVHRCRHPDRRADRRCHEGERGRTDRGRPPVGDHFSPPRPVPSPTPGAAVCGARDERARDADSCHARADSRRPGGMPAGRGVG